MKTSKPSGELIDDVLDAARDAALAYRGGYGKTMSEKRLDDTVQVLASYIVNLEVENANLVRANSVLSDQYDVTFRWIPFSEERPPEDVSRYAVHQNGREKFWHPLAPRPTKEG